MAVKSLIWKYLEATMTKKTKLENFEKQLEFIRQLKANELTTPNDFTIGMGLLIREAREDKGLSQADLAKTLNRRQGTISDIENGKSEIGILTLVQFAVELNKPISYFFPKSLLKDYIVDVKTKFQHTMLERAGLIEMIGDTKLTMELIDVLTNHFEEDYERALHPENYLEEDASEDEDE